MVLFQGTPSAEVTVSNMGVAKKGPVIVEDNQLMLEYTDGATCEADGKISTYTTRIHFVCSKGPLVRFRTRPLRIGTINAAIFRLTV